MTRVLVALFAALLTSSVYGCSVVPRPLPPSAVIVPAAAPAEARASAPPSSSEDLSRAIDSFGFRLLGELSRRGGDNVVVSPLSVHTALTMTANGAAGETRRQMAAVLGEEPSHLESADRAYARFLSQIPTGTKAATVRVANALFADPGVQWSKPFLATDRDCFGAQIQSLDLAAPGAADLMNSWVASQTAGKIQHLVSRVDTGAVLFLLNAVYFKNDWETPFEPSSTHDQPFHLADGSTAEVPMMHGLEGLSGYETQRFAAARIPYKDLGSSTRPYRTSMYVFVPKADSTPAQVAAVVPAWLETQTATRNQSTLLRARGADLTLPRFKTSYSSSLNEALSAMGMPVAFDRKRADFSAMRVGPTPQIWIGDVEHATAIDVNEKGTEAAAATSVEMMAGAVQVPSAPIKVTADQPFVFAIVDDDSGCVLFAGVVNDPRK